MNGTQKLIMILLIVAIVFSAMSIFISLSIDNLDSLGRSVSGKVADNGGGIRLYVESKSGGAG